MLLHLWEMNTAHGHSQVWEGDTSGTVEREKRKSETMAFCASVKRTYERTKTGMSLCGTVPLWQVSCFGWGWTKTAQDPICSMLFRVVRPHRAWKNMSRQC